MKFAGLAGMLTIIGSVAASITWMFFHFETKEIASIEHNILMQATNEAESSLQTAISNSAAWNEIDNIENQIKIATIDIKGFERLKENRPLTESEQTELDTAREKREALQMRLDELIKQQREKSQGVTPNA
jgi:hypothetical protein